MKYGPRTNDRASLKLSKPKALPEHMHNDVIELSALRTHASHRRQGHARQLMREVCFEADLAGKFLFIAVEPGEGIELQALTDFYIDFGFVPIQAKPLLMTRPHIAARGIGIMPFNANA